MRQYGLNGITDTEAEQREVVGETEVLSECLESEGMWAPEAEVHLTFTSKAAAARLLDKMARSLR